MGYARRTQVSLQDTPYYHLIARCVRRARLWGVDEYAGRDYSHRKEWVLELMQELSSIFAIDICAYAIMSNHYHLVIYVDQLHATQWTQVEVAERWERLFSKPPLIERWERDECNEGERAAAEQLISRWRTRLQDVSWYMRCLNERLARRANAEDECTGRFWEGRFKSQALLDEAGLLTAMAYVDLNPIRAGIAATPEESVYTSIYERIRQIRAQGRATSAPRPPLRQFRSAGVATTGAIPFELHDYIAIVDWTGRARRDDKLGAIDSACPPILQRLALDPMAWRRCMQPSGNVFGRALGKLDHMRLHARTLGQAWVRGLRTAETLYGA